MIKLPLLNQPQISSPKPTPPKPIPAGIASSPDETEAFLKTDNGSWTLKDIPPQEFHKWVNGIFPFREGKPDLNRCADLQYRIFLYNKVIEYHQALFFRVQSLDRSSRIPRIRSYLPC